MTGPTLRRSGRRPATGSAGRRVLAVLVTMALGLLLTAAPAAADPAGPTDYRSEVVAVEPDGAGVELDVLGGDSFLQLRVPAGVEVVVVGYQEEPYLRFDPDGTVSENRNSPTTYLNEDRYGDTRPPRGVSAASDPEWREVGSGGRYAWHDHRIHWMLPEPPAGLQHGEQIVDGVVPLLVDGDEVAVRVTSTWLAPPSGVPLLIGAAVGAVVVVGSWRLGGRYGIAVLALVAGVAATAVAAAAYLSVPAETGRLLAPVVIPLITVVLAVAAAAVPRLRAPLGLAAGAELLVWVYLRRAHLDAAVLPTDAPFWLDRGAVAAVAVAAVGLVAMGLRSGALGPLGPVHRRPSASLPAGPTEA